MAPDRQRGRRALGLRRAGIGRKGGRGTDRGDGCHYQFAAIDAFYSFIRHGEVLSDLKSTRSGAKSEVEHSASLTVCKRHAGATSQARGDDRTIARMPSDTPFNPRPSVDPVALWRGRF